MAEPFTTTTVALADAYPAPEPEQLVLSIGGAAWLGTFALAVQFVLTDLLSDGPLTVSLVTYNGGESVTVYRGDLLTFEGNRFTFLGLIAVGPDATPITVIVELDSLLSLRVD